MLPLPRTSSHFFACAHEGRTPQILHVTRSWPRCLSRPPAAPRTPLGLLEPTRQQYIKHITEARSRGAAAMASRRRCAIGQASRAATFCRSTSCAAYMLLAMLRPAKNRKPGIKHLTGTAVVGWPHGCRIDGRASRFDKCAQADRVPLTGASAAFAVHTLRELRGGRLCASSTPSSIDAAAHTKLRKTACYWY